MKTELVDLSETQKRLTVEIPSDVVDAEIDRVAKTYSKQAKIPGFRPGKAPSSVVKTRFREQILHDVMHHLVPRAIDSALQERGIEPVDTPDVRNVALEQGRPLTFTASLETVPPFDAGLLTTLSVTRPSAVVTDEDVEQALRSLRERGAKSEPVEGRGLADGDTAVVDIARTDAAGEVDRHENLSVELGGAANPPGFDANLIGMGPGDEKTFAIHFPDDYVVKEMAGAKVVYAVAVKEVRRKALPELDDEFAKDLQLESLDALRARVREDLEDEAKASAARRVRSQVLKQLADRMTFEPPASMIERELDRRVEELAGQLIQQRIDPREAGIDWGQFRESQRDIARTAIAGGLALEQIARREGIEVSPDEVEREIERLAVRVGRTPAALRAQLDKEGGLGRLAAGLRREKTLEHALAQAGVTEA